jgi:polysaccharide deacetylase family protein (PEP-CTERM system associated)
VDGQVARILDLFDERGVSATFFVLGWVAAHNPGVVRRIAARGHEIGCHSYAHRLVFSMTPAEFREDTLHAVDAIANACGLTPTVYRAPTYSIRLDSLWALEILVECGFTADSSIYPIAHDRYGIPGFSRYPKMMHTASGPIQEIPIATVALANGVVAPVGGGAYLRLLPYRYTAAGLRRINTVERKPACIYFHPWEIDPAQPRLTNGVVSRMRTYTGIGSMYAKIDRLLSDFSFSTVAAVYPNRRRVAPGDSAPGTMIAAAG